MGNYAITSGIIQAPERVVVYGPEGIGKSSFAAQFPNPVFIDTEGGSGKLNVQRLPRPSSWSMLLDEIEAVRTGQVPCGTLVIDTADWAERLSIQHICTKAKVDGLEGFGYGKGYVYAKEEFGRMLDLLDGVKDSGHNVVVTAHAQISKYEQPDEMGSYDRWSMKTSKYVAPMLREWCDMLLFATYKTFVVKDGEGKMAKGKAQGGRRIMYTTHNPCWDAKNRDGLPDECDFDYKVIAPYITAGTSAKVSASDPLADSIIPNPTEPTPASKQTTTTKTAKNTVPTAKAVPAKNSVPDTPAEDFSGINAKLRDLMNASNVTQGQLQQAVALRGYFPEEMPVCDYPTDFVEGCLCAAWPQLLEFIKSNCDVPF